MLTKMLSFTTQVDFFAVVFERQKNRCLFISDFSLESWELSLQQQILTNVRTTQQTWSTRVEEALPPSLSSCLFFSFLKKLQKEKTGQFSSGQTCRRATFENIHPLFESVLSISRFKRRNSIFSFCYCG